MGSYDKTKARWRAYRHSKNVKRHVFNGYYKDEEAAAHASDTLARELIANGEKGHNLNFPDDDTEVYAKEKTSTDYIGITYESRTSKWRVQRWSKNEKAMFSNGCYKDENTAAHASDTLGRKLIANGEKGHKINFPNLNAKEAIYQNKRKRKNNVEKSQDNESN